MTTLHPPRVWGRQLGANRVLGLLAVGVLYLGAIQGVNAQVTPRLEQASNGTPEAPISAVDWVNATITAQRGHYVESSSIPYRLVFDTILPGAHRVVIAWDTKTGGRHATDYLTYYNRLQPHNQFGAHNVPETIQALRNISGGPSGPSTFPIPGPSQAPGSLQALPPGQRVFHIFNGTITGAVYVAEGSLANASAESRMAIDFAANGAPVVILFGGHLAAKEERGAGQTAGGVAGLGYRMRVVEVDGLPTLPNVLVDAQAVVAPPTCNISGPDPVCPAITNIYGATSDATNATFTWALTANTAGALIIGPNSGPAVQVRSGDRGGLYTLQVAISAGPLQSVCSRVVTVLTNASTSPLANASACPGGMAVFSTTPSGPGPFTFLWRKGDTVLTGEAKSQLVLSNVSVSQGGLYCVDVSGPCNTVTSCATLTINSNTTATPLANLNRCVGDGAVFVTTASGAGPFAYRWRKNGVEIAGQTNRILSIPNLVPGDAGTYTVEVAGLCNSVTNSGQLVVHALPPCGIQGPATICPQSADSVFVAPPGMAEYRWRVMGNGGIVGPTNQQSVILAAAASGFLTLNLVTVNSNGCSRSCSRTITVGDIQPPVVLCPEKVQTNTEPGQCSRTVEFAVTASDNCGGATVVCNPASGTKFPKGTTVVNCTATDLAGNQAGCSFNVGVVDLEKPKLSCPTNLVVSATPGLCEAAVTYNVSITDNCPDTSLTCSPPSGTVFPLGTSSVTCRGSDAAGNIEFCTFDVTVVDQEGPQITCPPDLVFMTDPGQCDVLVDYSVEATDNCAMAKIVCVPPSGSLFAAGITTVICVATDVNQNQSRRSFMVEVDDGENPRIVCPGDITAPCEPGKCDVAIHFTPEVNDNCADVTLICVPPSGARFRIGQTNVNCTATDGSGNSASCTFKVTVADHERPMLACPTNMLVNTEMGRCDAVVQYSPVATDNCAGPRVECAPPSGSVFPTGLTMVNCFATDANSNEVSCAFNVIVQDAEPPHLLCPGMIISNALPGQCAAFVDFGLLPTDNCVGVEVFCDWSSEVPFPVGEAEVYCVAIDASGNAQGCTFSVVVNDVERPVIVCPPDVIVNTQTGRCDAVATFAATATDNCGAALVTCVPPSGSVFLKGTNVVNCTARDASGNTAGCAFRVIVYDREAPALVCPASIVTNSEPGRCDALVTFGAAANDNCSQMTVVCSPASGSRFVVGHTAVTCVATDASGNTNRCSFTVTVNDLERPEVICPADVATATAPGQCDAQVNFSANAFDNCPGATVACVPPSGSRFPRGGTVVACTAIDASGNVAACAFTVTVNDNQPPAVSCPTNIVTNTITGRCDAVVSYAPSVTDNCAGTTVICAPPSGATFVKGVTPVNCVATDASGNTNRCSFTMTVQDREKPVIACPPSQELFTAAGSCDAVATFEAQASDNCGGVSITCVPPSGSRFAKGVTNVTCTAADDSGNIETCSFTVTVRDIEPPVLTCPTNMVVAAEAGGCDAVVTFSATAADHCAGVTVGCVPPTGTRFARGTTAVNCTATDASSNSVTCGFTVKVEDRENPRVVCPANVVTNTAPGRCDRVVEFATAVTDNCGRADVVCTPPSGSTFALGTNTVICTATDAAGNGDTCTFLVAVLDGEKPAIACPGDVTANTDTGRCDAPVTFAASATDNCALATVVCNPLSGSRFNKGVTTVTCTATDATGNAASCSFRVTVNDHELPAISCPPNLVFNTDAGVCSARATFLAQVSDNCPGAVVECAPPSGSEFPIGITTVVCHATDASGNSRSCAFDVRVMDTEPPRLTCPGDTIVDTEPTECTATVSYAVTGDDACGLTNLVCTPASGSLFNKGVTLVQCRAKDASGNESTCSFNVTVRDREVPTMLCPTNVVTAATLGRCDAMVEYEASASDNCPGVSIVCIPASGSTFAAGTTLVNCTATDAAGNTNHCAFTVRVIDSQKPVLTCPTNIVVNCETNRCDATVSFPVSVADNCGAMALSCTPSSGSRFGLGSTPVTCSSTDGAGNVGTCSFTVTVRDTQSPVLQCPTNVIAAAQAGRCDAPVTFNVSATDNCGAVNAFCFPPSGSYFPVGTSTVNCSATDGNSNPGACEFTVTVRDLEAPTLQCPADLLVNAPTGRCDAVVSFAPQASDNCSSVTVSCAPPSGTTFLKGTNYVTCAARDAGSNSVNCTFKVLVRDVEKPQIVCPSDIVVSAENSQCRARVTFSPTATDNCNGATVVCTPPSNTFFNKGVTTVICVATDTSGNTNRCSFTVTVNDTMPPNITCPANIATNSSHGQRSAVVQFAPVVSDNCSGVSYICTPQSGSVFQEGVTPVSCTATDGSGNMRSCSFTVTVNDAEPPVITCPTNVIVATSTGRCDGVGVFNVTATDNSQNATVVCTPPSGSVFQKGLTDLLCTATDPASNRVTCGFTVMVVDLEAPVIACPTNSVLYTDLGRCDARVAYTTNVTDNCGGATLTCTPPSGALLPKGTNTVTCTASDTSGNVQVCAFTVRVVDNERPSVSCPGKMTFATPPGQCSAIANYNVGVADNCPGASVTCSPPSGSDFAKGTTTVNCTARDASGNTAICSFQVEVRDLESPVITCPADVNTASYPGSCGAPISYTATVRDNCPGSTLSCTPPTGSLLPVGTNLVTCTAADTSGNTAACTFRVIIRDFERPTLTCAEDIVIDGRSGLCTPVATYSPTVHDNCPGAVVSCVPPSGTTFPQGTNRVQCTALDVSGNVNSCAFSVIVRLEPLTATALPSQTRCAGETVILATSATGSGPLAFTWLKDGLLLPGRTNASLALSNVTTSDSATYTIVVQGPCSNITRSATLTVKTPVAVNGMTNVTRCDCDPLVLSPIVAGSGPFSYVWRKNGSILAGANGSTLEFAKLTTNDVGLYTVEVSGACNTAVASAQVSVIKVPNPAVYTNSGAITIHDNAAAFPYPSSVRVTCVPQTVKRATVTLRGFTHTYPDDVDVMLTTPDGHCVMLMSDAGSGNFANNINITLDDSAAVPLPDSSQLFTGTFRPGNYDTDSDVFPVPAPKLPPAGQLAALAGTDANGFWSLFVVDDYQLDSGIINNGWVLRLYWEGSSVRITAPRMLPSGGFQMTVIGDAQTACAIEASPDLRTWTRISTITLTGPQTEFTDPNPAPVRFYRVTQP